jgi:hypothetical protein
VNRPAMSAPCSIQASRARSKACRAVFEVLAGPAPVPPSQPLGVGAFLGQFHLLAGGVVAAGDPSGRMVGPAAPAGEQVGQVLDVAGVLLAGPVQLVVGCRGCAARGAHVRLAGDRVADWRRGLPAPDGQGVASGRGDLPPTALRIVAGAKSASRIRTMSAPAFLVEELAEHVRRFRAEVAGDGGALLFVGSRGGVLRRRFAERTSSQPS